MNFSIGFSFAGKEICMQPIWQIIFSIVGLFLGINLQKYSGSILLTFCFLEGF